MPQQFIICCYVPLEMLFLKLVGSHCDVGYLVSWFWASWEVLWCRPMWDAASDWPLPTCLELPAIHSLWLLLLGLGACGKDPALHQGWLLPAPDLGADPQKSSGTLVRPVYLLCWLPIWLNHWKRLWLYFSVVYKLHMVGQEGDQSASLLLSSRLMLTEGNAPSKKDGVYRAGEWLSTEILVTVPLAVSWEPQTTDSSHTAIVCSTLLPFKPRVNSCEWAFVH